jgi:hypothetical protein
LERRKKLSQGSNWEAYYRGMMLTKPRLPQSMPVSKHYPFQPSLSSERHELLMLTPRYHLYLSSSLQHHLLVLLCESQVGSRGAEIQRQPLNHRNQGSTYYLCSFLLMLRAYIAGGFLFPFLFTAVLSNMIVSTPDPTHTVTLLETVASEKTPIARAKLPAAPFH